MNQFSAILLAGTICLCSCTVSDFDALDRILDDSEEYERVFTSRADSLKLELNFAYSDSARWEKAFELSLLYRKNSIDSTGKYVRIMRKWCPDNERMTLATELSNVWCMIHRGRHEQAVHLFETLSLPPDAGSSLTKMYYTTGYDCYSQNFGDASVSDEYPAKYEENARRFWLADSTSAASIDIHSRSIRRKGDIREAIRLLESIPAEKMTAQEYAQIEHHLAEAYRMYGNNAECRRHLINAACQDCRNNSKIYVSLYDIATLLLSENDPERANRYVDRAIHDAIDCNYMLGIKRGATLGLHVNEELSRVEKTKKRIIVSALVFFILLSAAILLLLLKINILLSKLQKSNAELEAKTRQLDDASMIKDGFLAASMEMAASYINQVDEEKKALKRTLKQEGVEALAASLRAPFYSDHEHINFNQKFDKAFLRLFPDFIRQLNALMKDGKQFHTDENGYLTTELRILALIRLGIDQSPRIAKILFISKGTVYTYRCNMRMAANCNPDEFEEQVKKLG